MEQQALDRLTTILRPVLEKYGILKAVVFGSLARGESTRRSDLDLMVVQKTDKRFLDRYDGIFSDVTDVVRGRDVDLLIYTPEELDSMANRAFMKRILKEGIVIYESERQPASG
jgi:predicted nucleotidyltransferase